MTQITLYAQPLGSEPYLNMSNFSAADKAAAEEYQHIKALTDIGRQVCETAQIMDEEASIAGTLMDGSSYEWSLRIEMSDLNIEMKCKSYSPEPMTVKDHIIKLDLNGDFVKIQSFVSSFIKDIGRLPFDVENWESFSKSEKITKDEVILEWQKVIDIGESEAAKTTAPDLLKVALPQPTVQTPTTPTPKVVSPPIATPVPKVVSGDKIEDYASPELSEPKAPELQDLEQTVTPTPPPRKKRRIKLKTKKKPESNSRPCPKCKEVVQIDPDQDPIIFQCPNCGLKGKFKRKKKPPAVPKPKRVEEPEVTEKPDIPPIEIPEAEKEIEKELAPEIPTPEEEVEPEVKEPEPEIKEPEEEVELEVKEPEPEIKEPEEEVEPEVKEPEPEIEEPEEEVEPEVKEPEEEVEPEVKEPEIEEPEEEVEPEVKEPEPEIEVPEPEIEQMPKKPSPEEKLNEYFEKAERYKNRNQYHDAVRYYDMALDIDPDNIQALNNKGIILWANRKYRLAIEHFDRVLEIEKLNSEAMINKAASLNKLGEKAEALKIYDELLAHDDTNADAWSNKGVLLFSQEKFEDAEECFAHAVKSSMDDVDAWFNLAYVLEKQNKFDDASKAYEKVLKLNPENNEAIRAYNYCLKQVRLEAYKGWEQ